MKEAAEKSEKNNLNPLELLELTTEQVKGGLQTLKKSLEEVGEHSKQAIEVVMLRLDGFEERIDKLTTAVMKLAEKKDPIAELTEQGYEIIFVDPVTKKTVADLSVGAKTLKQNGAICEEQRL